MKEHIKLSEVLQVSPESIESLSKAMEYITGKAGVVEELEEDITKTIKHSLEEIGLDESSSAEKV